eukprot:TRINITY_DN1843_c0_g1_i1.p1 TRINITY_DN1843_c0_g1~~TRINITY_DN1843_c0_g1_i1.p1  ORF type:complete len:277 (+),score=26.13 TRINITY_DN1843_c0_g1_i1:124-954(+)
MTRTLFVRAAHDMSFAQIFHKSNTSFSPLRGSAVECTVRPSNQNMVTVDTGLKTQVVCFQNELGRSVTEKTKLPFGVDSVESFGEPKMVLPKELERRNRIKEVWTELGKIWRSDRNMVKGLVMNRVNGGYAVAIAGYIAFVPWTLLASKRLSPYNPWKMFNILNMRSKIGNIVLREGPRLGYSNPTLRSRTWLSSWNSGQPRSKISGPPEPGTRPPGLPSWNDFKSKPKGSGVPTPGLAPLKMSWQIPRRPLQPRNVRQEGSDTNTARSLSEFFLQ